MKRGARRLPFFIGEKAILVKAVYFNAEDAEDAEDAEENFNLGGNAVPVKAVIALTRRKA